MTSHIQPSVSNQLLSASGSPGCDYLESGKRYVMDASFLFLADLDTRDFFSLYSISVKRKD